MVEAAFVETVRVGAAFRGTVLLASSMAQSIHRLEV